jgi:hypothetical protein
MSIVKICIDYLYNNIIDIGNNTSGFRCFDIGIICPARMAGPENAFFIDEKSDKAGVRTRLSWVRRLFG